MKPNLKDFPNWNMPIPDYEEAMRYIDAVWEWATNFEKELREKLKEVKKNRREHSLDFPNAPASPLWERNYGKEQMIKEILGDVKTDK